MKKYFITVFYYYKKQNIKKILMIYEIDEEATVTTSKQSLMSGVRIPGLKGGQRVGLQADASVSLSSLRILVQQVGNFKLEIERRIMQDYVGAYTAQKGTQMQYYDSRDRMRPGSTDSKGRAPFTLHNKVMDVSTCLPLPDMILKRQTMKTNTCIHC